MQRRQLENSTLRQGTRECVQPHPADSVKNRLTSGIHQTCAAEPQLKMETLVITAVEELQLLRHGAHTAQGMLIQIWIYFHALSMSTRVTITSATIPPCPRDTDAFACFQAENNVSNIPQHPARHVEQVRLKRRFPHEGLLVRIVTCLQQAYLVDIFMPTSRRWNEPRAETSIDPSLIPTTRGSCAVSQKRKTVLSLSHSLY